MKKLCVILGVTLSLSLNVSADVVVLWNFNTPVSDVTPATGTLIATDGVSPAATVGGVTNQFSTVASAGASDPETLDDSEWRVGAISGAGGTPAQGTANKTAGVEFRFSTVGYENISVTWDHYNSATASRYYRVQYTTNGTSWVDHNVITNVTATTWINQTFTASFVSVPDSKNNPNFGVRLVTEFESTAVGTANNNYVGVSSGYGTAGTLWMDMFTVLGDVFDPNNLQPFISSINNLTTRVDTATSPIAFTVGDVETAANNLVPSLISSDTALVNNNYSFGGSGSNRTVTITPEPGAVGVSDITIRVTDEGAKFNQSTFRLTVLPTNTAPAITSFPHQIIQANTSTTNIAFTINDAESDPTNLSITVHSANPVLLSQSAVTHGGAGTNRTIQLTPAANEAGASWITVVVSDGTLSASNSFMLKVLRSQIITLWSFNSVPPDNNLTTGTNTPAIGNGTATNAGTATNSLNSNVGAVSFDPAPAADNSKWRFGSFPTQATENKTSGAEFRVSTVGYQNIAVSWDHYNSATGNRYWRLQYTLDGVNFTDYSFVYTNPVDVTWFPTGASLAGIPGANNNPAFGLRIVSEWESTATGQGVDQYVGTQASGGYSVNGTLWLDMVTLSGDSSFAQPALAINRAGNDVQVSWPTNATGFTLKSKTLLSTGTWDPVAQTPAVVGGNNFVTITNATGNQFFRLEQ